VITGRIYDETTQRESLLGLEGVSVPVRPPIYKDVCAFFTVSLEFRQPVMLVRDPTIKAVSSTWGVSVGDSAEVEKLQWSIGQAVGLCLSEFVKDVRATPLH